MHKEPDPQLPGSVVVNRGSLGKGSEEVRAYGIHFVGEQAGGVESELKMKLKPILEASATCKRAYLARAKYGDEPEVHVVLALEGKEDRPMLTVIGQVFHTWAAKGVAMDMMYLNKGETDQISRVCRPFYERH